MRALLLVFFIVLFGATAGAEEKKSLEIDREAWQSSIEHLQYEPEADKKIAEEQPDFDMPDLSWLKYVAYLAVGLVIILILVALLKNARPVQNIDADRIEAKSLEEAEDNLPEVMLNQIFEEALNQEEYKKALRIKFLMVLQSLIDKGMIVWKKRKTNEQYVRELTDERLLVMFRTLALAFDDIWYGEADMSVEQFNTLITGLDSLNTKIHGG